MLSVWSANSDFKDFSQLNCDIKTQVAIIGGGIAGILCGYMLKQKGIDCVILEADRVCKGVTQNTTAKITSQHGLVYDKLINKFGIEKSKMYLESNENAVKIYRKMCKDIDCDFEDKDNYVYSTDNLRKVEKELHTLVRLGYKPDFTGEIPVPISIEGAVIFPNQAQFNPLKFLLYISRNLQIYEKTKVIEIKGNYAYTSKHKIKADYFIVTTHFPFINKYGGYFIKMYQERSYVIALENGKQINGMYVDEAQKGMSFRNYKNLLLIGGGDHRTGKSGGNYTELRIFAKNNYPSKQEVYHWATQDCMTLDNVPYIGRYSPKIPNVLVATGFNKWGMTSSLVAAEILSDMVINKKNEYEELYTPSRSVITPQFAVNLFESAVGILTPSKKRCPHLGCALKWNSAEHTWDCPCHGSRFNENGKLVEKPATDDLK
ncbi:MAG: FAD-dependent oxidoreductase [Clostridia bacterium]|nr:FAD-dependent oxidoreductase [Clostridia bacterium]